MGSADEAFAAYMRATAPEERTSEGAFKAGAAWAGDELATLRGRLLDAQATIELTTASHQTVVAETDALRERVKELEAARASLNEDLNRIIEHRDEWQAKADALRAENARLVEVAKELRRAYVRLLEAARDRINDLGGDCDPIDVMERGDPDLRKFDTALARTGAENG